MNKLTQQIIDSGNIYKFYSLDLENAIKQANLSVVAERTYRALLTVSNKDGDINTTDNFIASLAKISRRSIINGRRELEKEGLLITKKIGTINNGSKYKLLCVVRKYSIKSANEIPNSAPQTHIEYNNIIDNDLFTSDFISNVRLDKSYKNQNKSIRDRFREILAFFSKLPVSNIEISNNGYNILVDIMKRKESNINTAKKLNETIINFLKTQKINIT